MRSFEYFNLYFFIFLRIRKVNWRFPFHLTFTAGLLEIQGESVLALALCTISALLVMIPARSKSNRYVVALVLMSNAGNTLLEIG